MHTENVIIIEAAPQIVFDLGADVERWPAILAHYRYVRVLGGAGGRTPLPSTRTVAMSATRSGIPVRWTATQTLRPEVSQIVYRHVAGFTRGMDVVWDLESVASGTRVRILHDLSSPCGVLRAPSGTWIAGELFISHIADRTLQGMKQYAESKAGGDRT